MTNIEAIQSMSAEELALWLAKFDDCPDGEYFRKCHGECTLCWMSWLQREKKDE